MTAITDVPQSGIYLQRGAIAQLIVTVIDINTGVPVPLQAATSLFIDILYPDRTSWRSFQAQLYTDGSDGNIVYTTINNGAGYSDLNQIGLYKMQGRAAIGDIPLPYSFPTDFYVQGNVADLATVPVPYPVLIANDGSYWQITVTQTGQLNIIPANQTNLAVSLIYMVDSSGQYWSLSATRTAPADAHLVTQLISGPVPANQQLFIVNSIKQQAVITVNISGNTVTN